MDESQSESESDFYESAEENVDLEEDGNASGHESKKNENESKMGLEKSAIRESEFSIGGNPLEGRKSIAYRKRPGKDKKMQQASSKSFSGTVTKSKQTHYKADATASDKFLLGISNNLTKNFNKSLNSIQQTSSNVKDLFMSSYLVTGTKRNEEFSYDDKAKFDSPDAESDRLRDETFSPANSSNAISFKNLENNSESGSAVNVKKVVESTLENEMFKVKTDIDSSLVDKKQEEKKTKLFDCDLPKKFDIPDISEFLNPPSATNLLYESDANSEKEKCVTSVEETNQSVERTFDDVHLVEDSKLDKKVSNVESKKCSGDRKTTLDVFSKEIKKKNAEREIVHHSELQVKKTLESPTIARREGINETPAGYEKLHITDSGKERKIEENSSLLFHSGESKSLVSCDEKSEKKSRKKVEKDAELPVGSSVAQINRDDPLHDSALKDKDVDKREDFITSSVQDSAINKSRNATRKKETVCDIRQNNVKPESEKKNSNADLANEKKSCEANDGRSHLDYRGNETDELVKNASAQPKAVHSVEVPEKSHVDASETFLAAGETKQANQNDVERENKIEMEKARASEEEKMSKGTTISPENEAKKVEAEKNEPSDWEWDEWGDDENAKASRSNNTEALEGNKKERTEWDWDDWDDEDDATEKTGIRGEQREGNPSEKEGWSGWDAFSQKMEEKQSNSWGSWGVNMLLDKATAVTQGISSALEAGLGAPDPETLARMEKAEMESDRMGENNGREAEEKVDESEEVGAKNSLPEGKLFSALVGVTSKIVENSKIQEIGSKVLCGGLDTLASFGKKTMEVLQEGDPGLKNKRAMFLGSEKQVLSQVLREIKEKTEMEMKEVEEKEMNRKCHFEGVFDDYEGLVHLEALEMLSTQCNIKLEQIRISMSPEEQKDFVGVLDEVEQLCSMDEYDLHSTSGNVRSFRESLEGIVKPFEKEMSIVKILEIRDGAEKWLESSASNEISARAIHQKLVSTLAQLTAAVIHQYHKVAELLCVKECRKTVEEIDVLSALTQVLINEIDRISERFVGLSKDSLKGNEALGSLINQIDSVKNNSTSFIKEAFNLLIPILQVGATM